MSVIGLGLAVDYSLLFIRRFREELEQASTGPEAMAG
ncbi:MMPL family transporter [Thermogemmatispora sp.]